MTNNINLEYHILEYRIYYEPVYPYSNGVYYGKTPIEEQALGVVQRIKESGGRAFIKAVCSDGITRYYA